MQLNWHMSSIPHDCASSTRYIVRAPHAAMVCGATRVVLPALHGWGSAGPHLGDFFRAPISNLSLDQDPAPSVLHSPGPSLGRWVLQLIETFSCSCLNYSLLCATMSLCSPWVLFIFCGEGGLMDYDWWAFSVLRPLSNFILPSYRSEGKKSAIVASPFLPERGFSGNMRDDSGSVLSLVALPIPSTG